MKIYFSGSIRGGREDQKIYLEIVSLLKQYGSVLTEHIGDESLGNSGESLSEEVIFERDMKWLEEADVIIAEVTRPSLGVGYEIGRAEEMKKPILCLYRPSEAPKISAMISGNTAANIRPYQNMEEVSRIFGSFFNTSAANA